MIIYIEGWYILGYILLICLLRVCMYFLEYSVILLNVFPEHDVASACPPSFR